jgi:predicted thioesterase
LKPELKTGMAGVQKFAVEVAHVIQFAGMPAVLSTPSLIALLERTAREAIAPSLPEGHSSVGTHINLDHLAATPLGSHITCTARIVSIDGRTVSFQLEARDEVEILARGFHRRQVLDVKRFVSHVERRKSSIR